MALPCMPQPTTTRPSCTAGEVSASGSARCRVPEHHRPALGVGLEAETVIAVVAGADINPALVNARRRFDMAVGREGPENLASQHVHAEDPCVARVVQSLAADQESAGHHGRGKGGDVAAGGRLPDQPARIGVEAVDCAAVAQRAFVGRADVDPVADHGGAGEKGLHVGGVAPDQAAVRGGSSPPLLPRRRASPRNMGQSAAATCSLAELPLDAKLRTMTTAPATTPAIMATPTFCRQSSFKAAHIARGFSNPTINPPTDSNIAGRIARRT